MTYPWYEEVPHNAPLSQGDLIRDCPVVRFQEVTEEVPEEPADGHLLRGIEAVDVVVMTQACDLEHGKVREVILCPTYPLEPYKGFWEQTKHQERQNPTRESWRKHLTDICDGKLWNLAMINGSSPGNGRKLSSEIQIVDFHEISSMPKAFLERWVMKEAKPRLRLLPPYREHLSQAFARYFMRVGLPSEIAKNW